jgi:hypothetical protein
MKVYILMLFSLVFLANQAFAQCCAGGSGSPIAGGTSQGVLSSKQIELNTNFQYINTNNFYTEDKPDTLKYFDNFHSSYQYFRLAYGVTEKLTMSIETGNFFLKEEIGLNNDPSKTYNTSGIGDLIIFPRYEVFNLKKNKIGAEITVGLGYKIPLGSYNDSTGNIEPFSGQTFYVTNPQAVQLTSGAQDIIFYMFNAVRFPASNFRIFATGMYIKKGWNPLGERLGDFSSVGLFAGKTFFEKLGITLQLRREWTDEITLNNNILLYAYPNYDVDATGFTKVFVTPQLNFTQGKFTVYGLIDIPVYQYVTKTQVGTELQATVGLSFRFFAMKSSAENIPVGNYSCPMHPEITSSFESKCPKCGMDLEKVK